MADQKTKEEQAKKIARTKAGVNQQELTHKQICSGLNPQQ